MFEIIRWISIVLCLVATAINTWAFIKNYRSSRRLDEVWRKYIEELNNLTKPKE